MHITTQRMVSTFDHLLSAIEHYTFHVITMSDSLLLQHVTIPEYIQPFNNQDKIRGGRVGVYIKESIKFKRRAVIEKRYPSL